MIFSDGPAALAAFTRNFPIAFLPRGLLQYQIRVPGFLLWLIAKKIASFIFSGRSAVKVKISITGQRSLYVASVVDLNSLFFFLPSPCLERSSLPVAVCGSKTSLA